MPIHETLLWLVAMLGLALVVQPVARWLHLPFAAILVVAGFAGSEIAVFAGLDTGLRADSFHDLVFYLLLPILLFDSALKIDPARLWKNLAAILILAIPVLLLSTLVTAALVYLGIAHPGFPWIAALLTGALLSATEPSALDDLLREHAPASRIRLLLEGESLFNDAAAIVLFSVFLGLALEPASDGEATRAVAGFLFLVVGGLLVGLASGALFAVLARRLESPAQVGLVTLVGAYTTYLLAEILFDVSGVMAILAAGLVLVRALHRNSVPETTGFLDSLWELNAYVARSLLFLLMGATITLAMFEQRWLAMLIGIAGVLVARAAGVFGVAPFLPLIPGTEPLPLRQQTTLFLGGLRGAVALALALSLPTELEYWWTIQSIVFGVVLFALFVQAPAVALLMRRNGSGPGSRGRSN